MKSKYLPHSKLGACRLPEICQLAARGRLNWTPNIQSSPTIEEIWIENSPQTMENKCKWTWKDFSAKRANQALEKIDKQRDMYEYNIIKFLALPTPPDIIIKCIGSKLCLVFKYIFIVTAHENIENKARAIGMKGLIGDLQLSVSVLLIEEFILLLKQYI